MRHELIYTKNYVLVCDDNLSEHSGYWVYVGDDGDPQKSNLPSEWFSRLHDRGNYKNVVAHLPLNDSPVLEGVDLLPPMEEGVEDNEALNYLMSLPNYEYLSYGVQDLIKDAYKAATTKGYSEDDLRKAIRMASGERLIDEERQINEIIQSLKQQPKYFVAEMETTKSEVFRENDNAPYALLKTTSIGDKTYLVGKYE